MLRNIPSTLGDFVAVISRRKYWIVIPAITVMTIVAAVSPFLPRTYLSTTTILVEPQKIPTEYVRATVTSDVTDRLHTIGLEVLSRTRLTRIINELNLYPELRKKESIDGVLSTMRKDVSIEVIRDPTDGKDSVGAFKISYIGRSPRETQRVTQEMANLFIRENLKERDQQAQGTDAFITGQLAKARAQLDAQDARIREFRDAHVGSLPEQEQANLAMIGQYEGLLQSNSDAIDRATQQRVYLQSVLNVHTDGKPGTNPVSRVTPLELQMAQKQAELNADLLKYTPEHPDVIRLKHDIATLKLQIQHAPQQTAMNSEIAYPLAAAGPSTNDQLRSQLVALNVEINARNARQMQVEQKLKQLQGSLEGLPTVQTQFSALDRDYKEMQTNYNELLSKQQAAAMAAELERHDESEQFIVLDPASMPSRPHQPDPTFLGLLGVVGGLLTGLLMAVAVEVRDDTMHTTDEVGEYLKLPIIIALPRCDAPNGRGWSFRRKAS